MLQEVIGQQSAFLKRYQQVATKPVDSTEDLLADVVEQLNLTGENSFELSADKTKNGKPAHFPFERQLISQDYDGTIETVYTYIGEPFETEEQMDEQQEW